MRRSGFNERAALARRRLRLDLGSFHLLHYRRVDGFLVTAKNSGAHWLRFMMSHALAHELGLPPPVRSSGRASDDFIGHPQWGRRHAAAPFIGSSHNLPSRLFAWPAVRRSLRSPPIVVLVRDIEQAMLSHYLKWREPLGLDLRAYARTPAPGRRDLADVWWYVEFFNRWGRMAVTFPDEVMVVRYEDLAPDRAHWLGAIFDHFGVGVSRPSIEAAARLADKATVRAFLDPDYGEAIVPDAAERAAIRFEEADRDHLRRLLAAHLEHALGYDPFAPAAFAAPADVGRAAAGSI